MDEPDDTSYDAGKNHAREAVDHMETLFYEMGYGTFEKQWFVRGFKEEMEKYDG